MNKKGFSKVVKGALMGLVDKCEKALMSPRFGATLMMLCMVSFVFAQNAAGDAVLRHRRCGRCGWCHQRVHQDEQRGAGCQEEHHDARGCLYLPDCSSPGSASVLRCGVICENALAWSRLTISIQIIQCSRGFSGLLNFWVFKVATSIGRLVLPVAVSSHSL